jgi:hypothetical protein
MFGTASILNRPTGKLVLAASAVELIYYCWLMKEAEKGRLLNTWAYCVLIGWMMWRSWGIIFKEPTRHKYMGTILLILGMLYLGFFAAPLLAWAPKQVISNSAIGQALGYCVGSLIAGYLLLFDKEIAAWRHSCRSHPLPSDDLVCPPTHQH